MKKETAVFGAGCFWHVELAFSKTRGVLSTKVGYMGGDEKRHSNPTYKEVCTDETGYAEVVKVTYNKDILSYSKLLEVFWKIHDPTLLNRQGPDVGTQYRSAIFYSNESQKKTAEKSKAEVEKKLGKKIMTNIVKSGKFFEAEEYHQKYLEKQGKNTC